MIGPPLILSISIWVLEAVLVGRAIPFIFLEPLIFQSHSASPLLASQHWCHFSVRKWNVKFFSRHSIWLPSVGELSLLALAAWFCLLSLLTILLDVLPCVQMELAFVQPHVVLVITVRLNMKLLIECCSLPDFTVAPWISLTADDMWRFIPMVKKMRKIVNPVMIPKIFHWFNFQFSLEMFLSVKGHVCNTTHDISLQDHCCQ